MSTPDNPVDAASQRDDRIYFQDLQGKVVLITGAANGIGQMMAYAFARHGCKLALLDIDRGGLESVKADLLRTWPLLQVTVHAASVNDEEALECLSTQLLDIHGCVDVVLNNAGVGMNRAALELTSSDWRRAIDTNVTSVFLFAQRFGSLMVQAGSGSIINIASIWGLLSSPNRVAYCTSKAAVVSMTKCLAAEWASSKVRVNAICPGYVLTPGVEEAIRSEKLNASNLIARTPLRRLVTTEEVAGAALYLASEISSCVTGHALVVDGGWTANGEGIVQPG
jgi:NAD(P)-dependent dehydrogenase (short-subunit alcohol dehydrogenase family)